MAGRARAFVIEVMLLEERWHGHSEWPPSPLRLFQALVAAAARGIHLEEADRQALQWLEELKPPIIAAPRSFGTGQTVQEYVPNNDLDAIGGDPSQVEKIRALKRTQPRLLQYPPRFFYLWRFEMADGGVHVPSQRLKAIVTRLHQFGRGIDMAFARAEVLSLEEAETRLRCHPGSIHEPCLGGGNRLATPCSGTLESLEHRFLAFRCRLQGVRKGKKTVLQFRQPPKPVFRMIGYACLPHRFLFELRRSENLEAFAVMPQQDIVSLVIRLRDFAADHLTKDGTDKALVERYLIGRNANPQDKKRRVRIIPLPSIGHEFAGGGIRRVLVEVPQDCPLNAADVVWALQGEVYDPASGELAGIVLMDTDDTTMLGHYGVPSLGHYTEEGSPSAAQTEISLSDESDGARCLWRTVTPAALPVQRGGRTGSQRLACEEQAISAVRAALRHAGVRARAVRIRVQREPFDRNSHLASQYEPDRFDPRQLWHVEILFAEPVEGPLVIGNGRFLGLGLMAPVAGKRWLEALERKSGAFVYALPGDGLPAAAGEVLLKTARAALMAIDAELHPPKRQPCSLFSGHPEDDSSPLRQGHHAHVFLAAPPDRDGRITRLYVIPPWLADRSAKATALKDGLEEHFRKVCQRLKVLYAPELNRLPLSPVSFDGPDPLLDDGLTWRSVTPYLPTRHLKKGEESELERFVAEDIRRECARRDLPLPKEIKVEQVWRGANGGLKAWVRMNFAASASGPFLLGRHSHKGGGVFVRDEGSLSVNDQA